MHVVEGDYNGLYVTHPPEKHDEVIEQRYGKLKKKPATYTQAQSSLGLNGEIKANLATQGLSNLIATISAFESKARAQK